MTARRTKRAPNKPSPKRAPGKVPSNKLGEINSLTDDLQMAKLVVQETELKLRRAVAVELMALKLPINAYTICLVHGTPFPNGTNCPTCLKG